MIPFNLAANCPQWNRIEVLKYPSMAFLSRSINSNDAIGFEPSLFGAGFPFLGAVSSISPVAMGITLHGVADHVGGALLAFAASRHENDLQ
jgi:hypothetical protein